MVAIEEKTWQKIQSEILDLGCSLLRSYYTERFQCILGPLFLYTKTGLLGFARSASVVAVIDHLFLWKHY